MVGKRIQGAHGPHAVDAYKHGFVPACEGLASCGSSVDFAGWDGRSTGTDQDRLVASVTVGSGKNPAVLSALFASATTLRVIPLYPHGQRSA